MVTREQIFGHTGRKPFAPFRVVLRGGDTVEVTRRLQAPANNRRMVVAVSTGSEQDRTRWIWLDEIDRLEPAEKLAA
jgi:hypothetical protein